MSKNFSLSRILIVIIVVLGYSFGNRDCFCTNRIDGYSLSAIQLNFLDYGKSEALETLIDKVVSKYNAVVKATRPIYAKMPYLKLVGTGLSHRVVKNPHISKQGVSGKVELKKGKASASKKTEGKEGTKKLNSVLDYKRTYKLGKQTFYIYYYPLDKNRITWTAFFTTKERLSDTLFKGKLLIKAGQEFDPKKIGTAKINPDLLKARQLNLKLNKLDLSKLPVINHRYSFSHYMDGQFESDVCINMQIYLDKLLRKFFNFGKELHPLYGTPMYGISSLLTDSSDECKNAKHDFSIAVPKDITRINKKTFEGLIETSINLHKVYKKSGYQSIFEKALEHVIKQQTGLEVIYEKKKESDKDTDSTRGRSVGMIDVSTKINKRQSLMIPNIKEPLDHKRSSSNYDKIQPIQIPNKSVVSGIRKSLIKNNDVEVLDSETNLTKVDSRLIRNPGTSNLKKPSLEKRNSQSLLHRNSNVVNIDDPFKKDAFATNSIVRHPESLIETKFFGNTRKSMANIVDIRKFITIDPNEIIGSKSNGIQKVAHFKRPLIINKVKPVSETDNPMNTPVNTDLIPDLPIKKNSNAKTKPKFFDFDPYSDYQTIIRPSQKPKEDVNPGTNYFEDRSKSISIGNPNLRPENIPSFEDYGLNDFMEHAQPPVIKTRIPPSLLKGDVNIKDLLNKMTKDGEKKKQPHIGDPFDLDPTLKDFVSAPVVIKSSSARENTPVSIDGPKRTIIDKSKSDFSSESFQYDPIDTLSNGETKSVGISGIKSNPSEHSKSQSVSLLRENNGENNSIETQPKSKQRPKIVFTPEISDSSDRLVKKNKSTQNILAEILKGKIKIPKSILDNLSKIVQRQKQEKKFSVPTPDSQKDSIDSKDLPLPELIAPIIEESQSLRSTPATDRVSITIDEDTPSHESVQKGLSPIPTDKVVIEKGGIIEFNPNDSESSEPVIVQITSAQLSINVSPFIANTPEISNIDDQFSIVNEPADINVLNHSINNIIFTDLNVSVINYGVPDESLMLNESINLKDLLYSREQEKKETSLLISQSVMSETSSKDIPVVSALNRNPIELENQDYLRAPTIKVIKPVEYVSAQIQTDSIHELSAVSSVTSIHQEKKSQISTTEDNIHEEVFKPVNISLPESFNDLSFQTIAPEELAKIQNEILLSELKQINSKPDIKDLDDEFLADQFSFEQSVDEEDDYKKLRMPQYNQPGTSLVPEILGQTLMEEAKNVNLVMRSDAAIRADLEAIKRDKLFEKPTKRHFIFDSRTSRELEFDKIVYPGVKTDFENEGDDDAITENLEFQRKVKFINWLIKYQNVLQTHSPAKYKDDWFRIDEDLTIECSRPEFQVSLLLYVLLFHQYELIAAQVTQTVNDYLVEVTNHFVYQIDGRLINVNIHNKEELSGFSEEDYEPIIRQMTKRLVPKIELIDTKVEIVDPKKNLLI